MAQFYQYNVIGPLLAALVIGIGWLVTWWQNRKLEKYKRLLDYREKQLCEFHGPLYFMLQSEELLWSEFRRKHRSHGRSAYFDADSCEQVTSEDLLIFREWQEHVFLPAGKEIRKLIIDKGHLCEPTAHESKVHGPPACLVKYCAHYGYADLRQACFTKQAEALEANPQRKHEIDEAFVDQNIGVTRFPVDTVKYSVESLERLLAEKNGLYQQIWGKSQVRLFAEAVWESLPV